MLISSIFTLSFLILFQNISNVIPSADAVVADKNDTNKIIGEENDDSIEHVQPPPSLPKPESLLGASAIDSAGLPVFPERPDAVYFIVAVVGGAKTWGRTLARTLLDMGPPFGSPQGPPLRPLYVDLPQNGRFSSKVLTSLCQLSENQPLAGIVVIGEGQSARTLALSGTAMKLPVLWAKGGTASLNGLHKEIQTPFQAMLQPSAKEILEAIRALLLQTHWHSFFVMSDMEASMVLGGNEGAPLKESPLVPTILPLPANNDDVFRQLAQISKSTRGVVLLLCDLGAARKIMSEAQRLNMVGGHFIWIWADTSSTTEFYDVGPPSEMDEGPEFSSAIRRESDSLFEPIDSSLSHHVDNLEERRMEFEDFDVKRQQWEKIKTANHFGHIIGLNTDGNLNGISWRDDLVDSGKKSYKRKRDQNVNRKQIRVENSKFRVVRSSNKFKKSDFSNSSKSQNRQKRNVNEDSDEYTDEDDDDDDNDDTNENDDNDNINRAFYGTTGNAGKNENKKVYDGANSENVNTNFGVHNKNPYDGGVQGPVESESNDNFKKPSVNFSEESDNNNKDANHENGADFLGSKLKRTPFPKHLNITSHVLFHHFKDFPIGLLALRPVRMTVDRHFIRSAIRLFAASWARVEINSGALRADGDVTDVIRNRGNKGSRAKNYLAGWEADEATPDENVKEQKNDNVSSKEKMMTKKLDTKYEIGNKYHNKGKKSKRSINISSGNVESDVNDVDNDDVDDDDDDDDDGDGDDDDDGDSDDDAGNDEVDISMHENSAINNLLLASAVNNSLNTTTSFNQSDLPLSIDLGNRYLRIQNTTSGLNDTMSNNKSNNKETIGISGHQIITDNIKPKPIKRQNTWWSMRENLWKSKLPSTERNKKLGAPQYKGGCFGSPNKGDIRRAEHFAKVLQESSRLALSGHTFPDGTFEKPLIAHFELLNLVPAITKHFKATKSTDPYRSDDTTTTTTTSSTTTSPPNYTKWRRVGLVSGTNVHLDTIVWPGGDIVVSGLSARPRSVFRVVTALSPPFVMETDMNKEGICLRGLPCHRLSATGHHNLTLMFNAIETRDRLDDDSIERGNQSPPPSDSHASDDTEKGTYKTNCCYGLSMDLLNNIATELGFEFHLYIVRDELFGTKFHNLKHWSFQDTQSNTMEMATGSDSNIRSMGGSDGVTGGDNSGASGGASSGSSSGGIGGNKALPNVLIGGSGAGIYRSNLDSTADVSFERKHNVDKKDKGNVFDRKDQSFYGVSSSGGTTGDGHQKHELYKDIKKMDRSGFHQFDPNLPEQWNGIVGDLVSGSADMSFAALSVSKARAEAIDFSAPYFHSGVSLLASPQTKSEIPLLAFLLPFSPELWIAIFTSLNITAIAVAVYEWLSPFGLNPWGRQRSKNFSMSSALWVMWGLLCGHLVAFKAPKSWPNKFLINVWGGFSVIFVASYTANIAALIAGLFFHNAPTKYDASLLTQRVGAPIATAAESYIQKNDKHLWEHMRKYTLRSIEDGIRGLKNGSLDLLMADSPILDYYRATDHGCNLQRIGETYVEDTYAIGMTKGFPLRDSISALIAKYSSNGYLDILTEKWYGGLPCFKYDIEIAQPRPLGVAAVAGVFLLLGLGMILGCLILIFEHLFYKYSLPILRRKPKGSVWKSRNIMFFSQKLYRFINCVELVSPHHAARELVHTLRQGQIASLFQKSIKRKEDEQRRRRKSKAQFFEMIQEIRRVQQEERNTALPVVEEIDSSLELGAATTSTLQEPPSQKPSKISPKPKLFAGKKETRSRSNSSGLNVRRFSTDSILGERLDTIGRRLSRDITYSPPDLGHRFETFGKGSGNTSSATKFDTFCGNKTSSDVDKNKFDTFSGVLKRNVDDKTEPEVRVNNKKYTSKRTPLNLDMYEKEKRIRSQEKLDIMPTLRERLAPPMCLIEPNKAVLREKLHEELREKYGSNKKIKHIRRPPQPLPPEEHYKVPRRSNERPPKSQHKQISLDTVTGGKANLRPTPSPRRAKGELEHTASKSSASSRTNGRQQITLDKLSKEELLMLSHSSQAEIHEYLQNSMKGKISSEPP